MNNDQMPQAESYIVQEIDEQRNVWNEFYEHQYKADLVQWQKRNSTEWENVIEKFNKEFADHQRTFVTASELVEWLRSRYDLTTKKNEISKERGYC